MRKWGMVIDLDRCTGCQACVVACKAENNVAFSGPAEEETHRAISWMSILTVLEGEYPDVKERFIPRPCMHCENPPCVKVCPVGATYKNPEGIVAQVYTRCIGCRYCTNNCPYTLKYFNYTRPRWPREMKEYLNPDVSKRQVGVVEKCTFCHHRLQKAKEKARFEKRALKEEDYVPACVQTCPTDALIFGDLENPKSEVHRLSKISRVFRLLEDLGTEPQVFYLTEGEWHG